MGSFAPYLITLGRLLLAPVFIQSGISKIFDSAGMRGLMEAHGLPWAPALCPRSPLELLGGLGVLLGLGTRWAALALGGFCVLAAFVFHLDPGDRAQTAPVLGEYLHGRRPLRAGRRRPWRLRPRQLAGLSRINRPRLYIGPAFP